jgi:hypothetical protein
LTFLKLTTSSSIGSLRSSLDADEFLLVDPTSSGFRPSFARSLLVSSIDKLLPAPSAEGDGDLFFVVLEVLVSSGTISTTSEPKKK